MSRTRSDYCVHCKINKHEMMCPFIKKEKEMMGPTLSLYLCMTPFFSPLNFTFSGLKLFWDETFMSSWQNVGLIFDYNACPTDDSSQNPTRVSNIWDDSSQMTVHLIFEMKLLLIFDCRITLRLLPTYVRMTYFII